MFFPGILLNGTTTRSPSHQHVYNLSLNYSQKFVDNRIATDPFPAHHKKGQEDATLARWLTHGPEDASSGHRSMIQHWVSEDTEIYDEPAANKPWSHPYTPGTLLIHRLKHDELFVKACAHFLLVPGPELRQES